MVNYDTNFVDYTSPPVAGSINAEWLNPVNVVIFRLLGNSSGSGGTGGPPTTVAQILTNLGISGSTTNNPTFTGLLTAVNALFTGNVTIDGTLNVVGQTTLAGATGVTPTAGDNSTKLATTAFVANAGIPPLGQCRLNYTSSSTITLVPYQGNKIMIAGVLYTIPSAGVTLVSPTMSASTLYYIYALQTSGTLSLVASTVGHQTDSTTGVEVWTTDNTHTLVGMVYCTTANSFTNTAASRLVRSWFNDPGVVATAPFTAQRTTTSTTPVEINTEIRNQFLVWSAENAHFDFTGQAQNTSSAGGLFDQLVIDGTLYEPGIYGSTTAANVAVPTSWSGTISGLSEGFHYSTLFGGVTGGTGQWNGAAAASTNGVPRCILSTYVHK